MNAMKYLFRSDDERCNMKKVLVMTAAASLLIGGVAISNAADYSFPTGKSVSIEKGEIPSYEVGSNRVYQIVSYFTVNFQIGRAHV